MFAFVRAVTGSEAAACCAGIVWGFCPFHFSHLVHLQLQSLYWMPLTFLLLHRLVAGRKTRDAVWLGIVFALQAVSSVYYGVIGAVGLLVAAAVVATRSGGWPPRLLSRFVLSALVAIVIAAPASGRTGVFSSAKVLPARCTEAENHSATVRSYLQAPKTNLVYGQTGLLSKVGSVTGLANDWGPEHGLFPGVMVILLALVGVARARRMDMGLLVASMAACRCGWTAPVVRAARHPPLYAALYDWVFGFQAIRAPARFSVLVFFALAVLAGLGLASLVLRRPRRREAQGGSNPSGRASAGGARPGAGRRLRFHSRVGLAGGPGADHRDGGILERRHHDTPPAPSLTTDVGRWLRDAPEPGPVLYLPIGTDIDDSKAMVAALEHGRPIVNGHSGQRPALYARVSIRWQRFPTPWRC